VEAPARATTARHGQRRHHHRFINRNSQLPRLHLAPPVCDANNAVAEELLEQAPGQPDRCFEGLDLTATRKLAIDSMQLTDAGWRRRGCCQFGYRQVLRGLPTRTARCCWQRAVQHMPEVRNRLALFARGKFAPADPWRHRASTSAATSTRGDARPTNYGDQYIARAIVQAKRARWHLQDSALYCDGNDCVERSVGAAGPRPQLSALLNSTYGVKASYHPCPRQAVLAPTRRGLAKADI
jgi:hypothetical protein